VIGQTISHYRVIEKAVVCVNRDCTAGATINVLVEGQLQRTAPLALVYDSNQNHVRMIFQSLTLPNSTNVPVVLTVDANRLVNKE
jgi:MOSC domain-containing protein YiiM